MTAIVIFFKALFACLAALIVWLFLDGAQWRAQLKSEVNTDFRKYKYNDK